MGMMEYRRGWGRERKLEPRNVKREEGERL